MQRQTLSLTRNTRVSTPRSSLRLSLLAAAVLLAACADMSRDETAQTVTLPAQIDVDSGAGSTATVVDSGALAIDAIHKKPVTVIDESDGHRERGDMKVERLANGPAPASDIPVRTNSAAEAVAGSAATSSPPIARQVLGKMMAYAPAAPGVSADAMTQWQPAEPYNERYQHLADNPVRQVAQEPVSTFSLDVDTGSYSNVRRMINNGQLPPKDAVRVEELVNYFPYEYPHAKGEHPFGVGTELVACPWNTQHWLLRVAVRAEDVKTQALPPANLVFLVDVSGSMDAPDKLQLLQKSLKLLVEQLREQDHVSLVVYAGRESVVLEPTSGSEKARIRNAIDALSAGGSTAGEAGIKLAYRMAKQGFIKGGINRVLLATDGDFNVGVADTEQLKSLVERERISGVSLSTLGFGTGNYNDAMMEQIADVGNGNYSYIDTLQEGRKVLVDQMTSTLATVAKDVKVQVEFNPGVVGEYRLIGYENRMLNREEFNNDAIDAGEVGAGASVTALYEITPAGATQSVDALRYGTGSIAGNGIRPHAEVAMKTQEVAFVRVRYKQPEGTTSRLLEMPLAKSALKPSFDKASDDLRFATAVAGFGQVLRGGKFTGALGYDEIINLASAARGKDEFGYRGEFLGLVRMAKTLGGS